jgi:SSS family solute:Na+ symporter
MSISAANLFTRSIYREYLRPGATPREEAQVSRWVSLAVKFGAVAFIVAFNPQFSVDLQLIGGVVILQALPAVLVGLYTRWFHRWALAAGLVVGLAVGALQLYQVPQFGVGGVVVRPHFGGSNWALSHLGLHTSVTVYAGLSALLVNLLVVVAATVALNLLGVPDGRDATQHSDYETDLDDPENKRLEELLNGQPLGVGSHVG